MAAKADLKPGVKVRRKITAWERNIPNDSPYGKWIDGVVIGIQKRTTSRGVWEVDVLYDGQDKPRVTAAQRLEVVA